MCGCGRGGAGVYMSGDGGRGRVGPLPPHLSVARGDYRHRHICELRDNVGVSGYDAWLRECTCYIRGISHGVHER